MHRGRTFFSGIAVLLLSGSLAILQAGVVDVAIYSGFSTTGGGAPYSGLVGTFTSPDVLFATDTGYSWHPFGESQFGAEITGVLDVAAAGTYSFALDSDDGSLLFVDGGLVVDSGGIHAPAVVSNSVALLAGLHPFRVEFFECCEDPSGVDLLLPAGVNYVPEPASLLLVAAGLAMAPLIRRLRRSQAAGAEHSG